MRSRSIRASRGRGGTQPTTPIRRGDQGPLRGASGQVRMVVATLRGHDRDMSENFDSGTGGGAPRRLTRTRQGRMITGVCSGAAVYFDVDPTVVRILMAVLTVLTSGAGIL